MSHEIMNDSFLVVENGENVHTLKSFYKGGFERNAMLLTDLHWDNPKCDRELLKKHLDLAVKLNAIVLINGDLFCLMQGKGDPRGNKDDVRPEHQVKNYIDAVVETAIDWFGPYAEHIAVIGRGNHEESVRNRQETDVLKRFVDGLNNKFRPKQYVKLGGYGGWIVFHFGREKSRDVRTYRLKYFHGTGGGGPASHGMPQVFRRQAMIGNADLIWTGHIHEHLNTTYVSEHLTLAGNIELKETEHITTATYKEEYGTGKGGYHIQNGRPPKPLGGGLLKFYFEGRDVQYQYLRLKK